MRRGILLCSALFVAGCGPTVPAGTAIRAGVRFIFFDEKYFQRAVELERAHAQVGPYTTGSPPDAMAVLSGDAIVRVLAPAEGGYRVVIERGSDELGTSLAGRDGWMTARDVEEAARLP